MGEAAVTASHTLKNIEWMWQSNPNPWSESEPAEWSHYSDLETLIIEGAYSTKQSQAILDDYYIDFKQNLQISNIDSKQRPIKRVQRKRDDKNLRGERFMDLPVGTGRSFSGEYGWVSPFIIEVRRDLGLQRDQLPSKDPQLIPMLVEKAAQGIITEAIHIRKQREAEKLAEVLLEKKNKNMKEVWQCCAYLYTLESFLYKTINAAMRLIGDKDHEEVWRSKVGTLGPFCLLLWDDPYNTKATIEKTLYRGANLKPEQIAAYEEMVKHKNEYRSFQAYTSCSRNRKKAEEFGNTLFIMDVLYAFIADLSSLSEYADEEEELVTPGVCFRVKNVEFDQGKNQHLINLELRQRFSTKNKTDIQKQKKADQPDDDSDRRGFRARVGARIADRVLTTVRFRVGARIADRVLTTVRFRARAGARLTALVARDDTTTSYDRYDRYDRIDRDGNYKKV